MRRALLSAGLLSVAAAAVWSDGAQARTFVATSGGTDLEVKPRNWTSAGVGSGAYMEDLAWRRWGSRVARATGTARMNDCDPSCADGTVHSLPGRMTLSRVKTCKGPDGRLRGFTRVRYRMTPGAPPAAGAVRRTPPDPAA